MESSPSIMKDIYYFRGRSSASGYNLNSKASSTISAYHIQAPGTPSLINYIPSSMGGSFRAGPYDDCSTSEEMIKSQHEKELENLVKFEDETLHHLWRNVRDLAGPWISHRFSLGDWDTEEDKNAEALLEAEKQNAILDDAIFDGVLTKKILVPHLTRVERCPEFEQYAYTKCVLSKKKLINIDLLEKYNYLQYVDVSNNKLTTLKALSNLPFLKILYASHNLLTTILDFDPPFFLTIANLSFNKIKTMRNLRDFWSITDLNLAHNFIRKIDGVKELRYLTMLNLSFNRIDVVENLEDMRVQFLYLQNNSIFTPVDEEGDARLYTLKNIRTINLSYNQISSLKMFEAVENLECLELVHNNVSKLLDIYYLRNIKYLNKLNLTSNPVTEIRRYVEVCVTHLKMLCILDGEKINSDFWLKKISNENTDTGQNSSHTRIRLLILEQLNPPKIWPQLLPYDDGPLTIIVLVGLQGSNRIQMARQCCKQNQNVVLGVPHTTNPKHINETDGDVYHYINEETFKSMLKKGEFCSYQEDLGCYYAIAHSEFKKAANGILMFCADLSLALILKRKFLNTVLVLTLVSTRKVHLQELSNLYAVKFVDSYTSKILNSPLVAGEYQRQFAKEREKILEMEAHEVLEEMVEKVVKMYDEMMTQKLIAKHSPRQSGDSSTGTRPSQEEGSLQLWWASIPNDAHRLSMVIHPTLPEKGSHVMENIDEQSKANLENALNSVQMKRLVSFRVRNSTDYSEHYAPPKTSLPKPPIERSSLKKGTKVSLKKDKLHLKKRPHMSTEEEQTYHIAETALKDNVSYAEALAQDARMKNVFDEELKQREELLELHLHMPGFFRELIFTDHEEESLEKLNRLIKDIIKYNCTTKNKILHLASEPRFVHNTKGKIANTINELMKEVSISQKQAAEYPVQQTRYACYTCNDEGVECASPGCPRWLVN